MQYLIAFCSQPVAASDVMSGRFVGPFIPNTHLKFDDHRRNGSWEIPPEVVGGGILDGFFRDNFRPEIDSDVISGAVVDRAGVNVPI